MIPTKYKWLESEPGPKMVLEALKEYGTTEIAGSQSNKKILDWAKEVGVSSYYSNDDIPWCGLFMATVAKRAGKDVVNNPLRALSWASFGEDAGEQAMLGDVLVFIRKGGGHVGLYVGEDKDYYHVLGGNQGDKVSITRIAKSRLYDIRRPKYNEMPSNVRKIVLDGTGEITTNEQ